METSLSHTDNISFNYSPSVSNSKGFDNSAYKKLPRQKQPAPASGKVSRLRSAVLKSQQSEGDLKRDPRPSKNLLPYRLPLNPPMPKPTSDSKLNQDLNWKLKTNQLSQ